MKWNIPHIDQPYPLEKYYLGRCLLFIAIVSILTIVTLLFLKTLNLSTNQMDDAYDYAKYFIIFCTVILIMHLIEIFVNNYFKKTDNKDNQTAINSWLHFGKRKIPLIGMSIYLPEKVAKQQLNAHPIIYQNNPFISHHSFQSAIPPIAIVQQLMNNLKNVLINIPKNQPIYVHIIDPTNNVEADMIKEAWRALGLPIHRLNINQYQQRTICEFFTSWYANSDAHYALILVLDQHSENTYWGTSFVMHNADYLLDKNIPIIAYLPRILTTDKSSMRKDIKDMATYQQPTQPITELIFLGLTESEKVNYVEQLYQTEYVPKDHVFMQQDLYKLSNTAITHLDWFGYSIAVLQRLGASELENDIQVITQQDDCLTVGVVMIS